MGLDAPGAARVLGKRPGAIRTATYRGLRTLAKKLEHADPGTDESDPEHPRRPLAPPTLLMRPTTK